MTTINSEEVERVAEEERVQAVFDAMVSTLILSGRSPAFQPEEVEALARAAIAALTDTTKDAAHD